MKKIFTFLLVLLFAASSLNAVNMTVTGSFPANIWNNSNADYLMTQIGTTGIYMLEKTLPAGTYEFKVFYTGTWNGASSGDNRTITLATEKVVKFYAKDDAGTIRFYSDAQQIYVIGAAVGGWADANLKLMTNSVSDATYTADIIAGNFKIVTKDKNNSIVWNDITPVDQTISGTANFTIKLDFTTFAVSSVNNTVVIPSLESVSTSYIFVGADPASAAWYNGSATFQAENFNGKNLGSITSPIMLGGEIKTSPVLEGVTVKMHHQIDAQTIGEITIPWLSDADGKSTWKCTEGTNVFTGATLLQGNSYSLKVWFSATKGETTLWDSNFSNNYVATFTYDVGTSSVQNMKSIARIYTQSGSIRVDVEGSALVKVYNLTGQILKSQTVESEFEFATKSGVYMLQINNDMYKVLVK